MLNDPMNVRLLLNQARDEGQWYAGQADAAALCFEVLARFPDHCEAFELVYTLFCDEWLIYDNRNALQQQIEEWDDRPWQQRRRLALSFRFMSRWEGWYEQREQGNQYERDGPIDVSDLLAEGRNQLLHAYLLGDEVCSDMAWPMFTEAMSKSSDQRNVILWVAKCYADLGFFADAVEVLAPLCALSDDTWANRLQAEVCWWRDNAHRIPWLPPSGNGSRYRRMMARIDRDVSTDEEIRRELRSEPQVQLPSWSMISPPDLTSLASANLAVLTQSPVSAIVDWSFLDSDDHVPNELPGWAQKMTREFPPEMADAIARQYRWSMPIPQPTSPPHHNPADPPFDDDDEL